MKATERSLLTLLADFALNTGLAIFVLVGQPDADNSASARAASPAAQGAIPDLLLDLNVDGRFRIRSGTETFKADDLPRVLAGRTNGSPRTIAVAYPEEFLAGRVHAALVELQRVFPETELNQLIQPSSRLIPSSP